MITKGFLMFWGGISGLVITLLLAIIIIISSKRNKRVVEKEEDIEKIKVYISEGLSNDKNSSDKSIPDTVLAMTDLIGVEEQKPLEETQVMK
jgi:hypothetical protein